MGFGTEGEPRCVACAGAIVKSRCVACGVPSEAGGFRVMKVLATGAHSRVLLAEKEFDRVALKELLFALVPTTAQLDAFEREARLLRQLSHPRIPRFVASFQEGEGAALRLYLAQEFVPGGSLLEELERRRFSEADAKDIAREVLEILAYLHGLSPKVIHRDVKPANLMRGRDGRLMLVDFGAARDLLKGVTHGATMVGTFGYMPPEQLGGTVDETSDLYALGASLLHLLSRKPPEELLLADARPDLAAAVSVSKEFAGWLSQLTHRERTKRFPTAKAALAALERASAPATAAPQAVAQGSFAQRRPVVFLGALVAVLSAGIAGAVLLQPNRPPRAPPPQDSVLVPQPPPVPATPAPPVPAASPRPAAALTREPEPKVDVAEVVEVKHSAPTRNLIRDDAKFAIGAKVSAATGCATPPVVELVSAELQAEGPGGLENPHSRLYLKVAMTNSGGVDKACTQATVSLRSPDGAQLDSYRVENGRPGTTIRREAQLELPRTLAEVKVCVEDECARTLELRTGKVRP